MADVFITGGTGYVGKFLVNSLIGDSDIKTITLLARDRKGASQQIALKYI